MRLLLAAVFCALAVVPAAEGWTDAGKRWPGPTITVWNGTGYRAAVSDAMRAWGAAGANIRFEAAPDRRTADVVVRYGAIDSEGRADVGYARSGGRVWLVRGLDRMAATVIAAHELGHVLGFGHDSLQCSLMAPVVNGGASAGCGIGACKVIWRCLVQPGDALGLRARYGRQP
jgi:hypothetical protein